MRAPNARRETTGPMAISLLGVAVAALLVAAGAGASPGTAKHSARSQKQAVRSVIVSTRTVKGLGTILVNAKGLTLYMFVPDKRKKVTCKGGCAIAWPPLKLPQGAKPVAKHAAKSKLLGSDPNPAGGRVVTYHGWPLYTWVGDKKPGQATGQALDVNGGLWYVLSPTGKLIKKKPTVATPASATTTAPASGTTTTASAAAPPPPSTTPATNLGPNGCPAGTTIQQNNPGGGDQDGDEGGGAPDDGDGCL